MMTKDDMVAKIAELEAERDRLKEQVLHWDQRLAGGVLLSNEEYAKECAELHQLKQERHDIDIPLRSVVRNLLPHAETNIKQVRIASKRIAELEHQVKCEIRKGNAMAEHLRGKWQEAEATVERCRKVIGWLETQEERETGHKAAEGLAANVVKATFFNGRISAFVSSRMELAGAISPAPATGEESTGVKGKASCGHPVSAIVSSNEGTSYCRECEEEARLRCERTKASCGHDKWQLAMGLDGAEYCPECEREAREEEQGDE